MNYGAIALTLALQQAKEYLKNKVYEFASDFLLQTLTHFIPGADFTRLLDARDRFSSGIEFNKDLVRMFSDLPFADMMWFEPSIAVTGQPKWDGISPTRGGTANPANGHPRPDILFKPSGTRPTDSNNGYLVGEFKLSVQGLWNDYFGKGAYSAKGKNRQWLAITNYARKLQDIPIAAFLTWDPGTQTLSEKISKEAFMRGVAVVILSLR